MFSVIECLLWRGVCSQGAIPSGHFSAVERGAMWSGCGRFEEDTYSP